MEASQQSWLHCTSMMVHVGHGQIFFQSADEVGIVPSCHRLLNTDMMSLFSQHEFE